MSGFAQAAAVATATKAGERNMHESRRTFRRGVGHVLCGRGSILIDFGRHDALIHTRGWIQVAKVELKVSQSCHSRHEASPEADFNDHAGSRCTMADRSEIDRVRDAD